jgi:prephenate dehydrogenase
MGGAIARALQNFCEYKNSVRNNCIHNGSDRDNCGVMRLFACDKDAEVLNSARQEGLIDQGWDTAQAGEMLSSCDVVFLCLNPSTIISFLEKWEGAFKSESIITDIAGTKKSIAAAAEKFRNDVDFIPGHPMAGAEKSGFENSTLCDFHGKNYILTPVSRNKQENIDFLKDIIYRMGFERITLVTPEEHDKKIAFTSQLCHVIAAALIDCEPDEKITCFGGGSFEDLTRIAMLNAPMWTELFIENSDVLLQRIDQFEESMDSLKTLIKNGQTDELLKRLTLVKERRIEMGKMLTP